MLNESNTIVKYAIAIIFLFVKKYRICVKQMDIKWKLHKLILYTAIRNALWQIVRIENKSEIKIWYYLYKLFCLRLFISGKVKLFTIKYYTTRGIFLTWYTIFMLKTCIFNSYYYSKIYRDFWTQNGSNGSKILTKQSLLNGTTIFFNKYLNFHKKYINLNNMSKILQILIKTIKLNK